MIDTTMISDSLLVPGDAHRIAALMERLSRGGPGDDRLYRRFDHARLGCEPAVLEMLRRADAELVQEDLAGREI